MISLLIPNVFLVYTWFLINSIYFRYNGVTWYLSTHVFICFMPLLIFEIRWNTRNALICIALCVIILIFLSSFLKIENLQQYRGWLLYVFPLVRLRDYLVDMQVGYAAIEKENWRAE